MFEHHRKSPWFAEKYSPAPEYKKLRQRVRKEGWNGRLHSFLLDLEAGKFDPDLTGSEPAPEPIVKETPANGGFVQTDSNGVASAVEESKPAGGEDEMQFAMDAEEDGGDHEASRADANGKASTDTKRIVRGDEISVMPEGNQVMIRTIPPDIGRVKLEEVRYSWFVPLDDPDFYLGVQQIARFYVSSSGRPFTKAKLLSGRLAEV
jgi:hypothetical protein